MNFNFNFNSVCFSESESKSGCGVLRFMPSENDSRIYERQLLARSSGRAPNLVGPVEPGFCGLLIYEMVLTFLIAEHHVCRCLLIFHPLQSREPSSNQFRCRRRGRVTNIFIKMSFEQVSVLVLGLVRHRKKEISSSS